MLRRGVVIATFLAFGCSKPSEAPFGPGDSLVYNVTYTTGSETLSYELTVKFKGSPGSLKTDFDVTPAEHAGTNVNDQEYSDKRPMKFPHAGGDIVVGQMYLPAADRQVGIITPTGRITGKRTHAEFETWAIAGASMNQLGTRFYDQTSGVLVGWNFEGITAKLVSPIPTKKKS